MESVKKNLRKHIETLCVEFGTRHSGSEGERLAGEYIEKYFTDLGIAVHSEEYAGKGWNFESFELYNVTKGRPVAGGTTACFFSATVDIEDKFFFVTNDDLKNLENVPVAGKMCFVTNRTGFDRNALADRFEALGAAALVFPCANAGEHADTKVTRSPFITKLGTACVNLTGAYDISKNKDDIYRLRIKANSFDTISRNIVAQVGSGPKKAVIGCHYDTAPLLQGASDNAAGTAMVMEFARIMKEVKLPFMLEFVAFSGEEYIMDQGPMGSGHYMQRHKNDDILWYLNCDSCADPFTTPCLMLGQKDKLPPLTSPHNTIDREVGGDNGPFCRAGIGAVWLGYTPGFSIVHTAEDSADKLDYDLVEKSFFEINDLFQQLISGTKI